MSVVVWDGKSLAVDRGATDGFTMWEIDKVWEHEQELVTGTGHWGTVCALHAWYTGGQPADAYPRSFHQAELIVVAPQGLRRFELSGPIPINHGLNRCAFGAGKDFAYGAMAMGADAERAVQIACEFSVSCGHGVKVFKVND